MGVGPPEARRPPFRKTPHSAAFDGFPDCRAVVERAAIPAGAGRTTVANACDAEPRCRAMGRGERHQDRKAARIVEIVGIELGDDLAARR